MTQKELENKIQKMIDDHVELNLRDRAYVELLTFDTDQNMKATRAIVENYPNFNSIYFRFEDPGHFVVGIAVNPKDIKTKKDVKKLAKAVMIMAKNGRLV